jgi:hypothetical protein
MQVCILLLSAILLAACGCGLGSIPPQANTAAVDAGASSRPDDRALWIQLSPALTPAFTRLIHPNRAGALGSRTSGILSRSMSWNSNMQFSSLDSGPGS